MKQALLSLFRVVGLKQQELRPVAAVDAPRELDAQTLRLVVGGDNATQSPKGTW